MVAGMAAIVNFFNTIISINEYVQGELPHVPVDLTLQKTTHHRFDEIEQDDGLKRRQRIELCFELAIQHSLGVRNERDGR